MNRKNNRTIFRTLIIFVKHIFLRQVYMVRCIRYFGNMELIFKVERFIDLEFEFSLRNPLRKIYHVTHHVTV